MNKIAAMCLLDRLPPLRLLKSLNHRKTETREPLLTWAPSAKKGHPVDYFVPNFGCFRGSVTILDSDMAVQQNSVAKSEAGRTQARLHPKERC